MCENQRSSGVHPKTNANIFSSLFFFYTFETFKKGRNNSWTETNLYQTLDSLKSETLGDKIEKKWLNHKLLKKSPSIQNVLFTMLWFDFSKNCVLLILSLMTKIIQPLLFGNLLSYFSPNSNITKNMALCFVILFILINGLSIVLNVHYKLSCSITAIKIRVSCTSLIQRKILKVSLPTSQEGSRGNALNLISNDLNRFDHTYFYVNYIWGSPLFIISIAYFVYIDIGLSGIVGMIWYILYIFLQSYFARLVGSYRNKIAKKTDIRVKLMNEILSGIMVIKMCVWEKSFGRLIEMARKSELDIIKKATYMRSIFYSLLSFANIMAIFIGIFTMVILDERITAPKVFNMILYYNTFNFVITLMIPLSIIKTTELREILKRVNNFVQNEELQEIDKIVEKKENIGIVLKNMNANWYESIPEISQVNVEEISLLNGKNLNNSNVLNKINLVLEKGAFLGITGSVGSGKSSLILSILGEMKKSGFSSVVGSISFASQNPWIFPGTIKENIIFDQNYDVIRYNNVLKICDLEKDLEVLPQQDKTFVGENGTSLSGGQRSRINLARTVYKNVDIYLFDDPFSSVDKHVGSYLMDECINGFLKSKIKVLVTNDIMHLRNCNHILFMESGFIENEGSFEELFSRENVLESSQQKVTFEENEENKETNVETVYYEKIQKFDKK